MRGAAQRRESSSASSVHSPTECETGVWHWQLSTFFIVVGVASVTEVALLTLVAVTTALPALAAAAASRPAAAARRRCCQMCEIEQQRFWLESWQIVRRRHGAPLYDAVRVGCAVQRRRERTTQLQASEARRGQSPLWRLGARWTRLECGCECAAAAIYRRLAVRWRAERVRVDQSHASRRRIVALCNARVQRS